MKTRILYLLLLVWVAIQVPALAQEYADSTLDNGPIVVFSDTTDTAGSVVVEEYSTAPNPYNQDFTGHELPMSLESMLVGLLPQWMQNPVVVLWLKQLVAALVVFIVLLLTRLRMKRKREQTTDNNKQQTS